MEEREQIDIPDLSNLNVEFFLSSNPDQIFINHHRPFVNFSVENCIASFSFKFQNQDLDLETVNKLALK